jgi:hypothetical protein
VQLLIMYSPSTHAEEQSWQLLWPVTFWYSTPKTQSVLIPSTHFAPTGQMMHDIAPSASM